MHKEKRKEEEEEKKKTTTTEKKKRRNGSETERETRYAEDSKQVSKHHIRHAQVKNMLLGTHPGELCALKDPRPPLFPVL